MPKKANQIVKESNAIARAEIIPAPESVWEERLIAKVAAFNRVDSSEFPENVFEIGELLDKNPSGSQLRQLEKSVLSLARSLFRIRENAETFTVYPIFAFVKYKNGVITAQFNPKLRPYYLELKQQFAIRSLPEFNSLSGMYSQRLYRFLNSWRNLPEAVIPLEELHRATSATSSLKKNFKDFRARVLEPAHLEINDKTSLFFAWEPIREGLRKVIAVRFVFTVAPIGTTVGKAAAENREEHEKLQKSSNTCFEKHKKAKLECSPKRSKKCRFCQERGRMFGKTRPGADTQGGDGNGDSCGNDNAG